ncbi:MAG TPA: VOC family protein [Jatrophihabitans sp.]|jgi:catechol 2,3-dioxygenase-like lactoylglutathione lyase family enzyme|nr:VOC family protein [Jatrophihabitans sp.]
MIELNHTIVWARDKAASAHFLADLLGIPVGAPTPPFLPLQLGNAVTLDYAETSEEITSQHYAFLVDDATFDAAWARIRSSGVRFWADPQHSTPGEINTWNGGRGLYFADPVGHNIELLTQA